MEKILIAGLPGQTKNYVAAVAGCAMEPTVSLALPDREALAAFDGLLLPGGADIDPARYGQPLAGSQGINPSLDDAQFAVLEAFLQAGKPILGICKGHQILNVRFGGDLIQDLPDSEPHRAAPDDKIHMTHALPDSWLAGLYGTDFPTNSAHHQAIGRPGQGFQVIQQTPDGVIEAIAHPGLPILSLQWHPERMCFAHRRPDTVDGRLVFLYFRQLCRRHHAR